MEGPHFAVRDCLSTEELYQFTALPSQPNRSQVFTPNLLTDILRCSYGYQNGWRAPLGSDAIVVVCSVDYPQPAGAFRLVSAQVRPRGHITAHVRLSAPAGGKISRQDLGGITWDNISSCSRSRNRSGMSYLWNVETPPDKS